MRIDKALFRAYDIRGVVGASLSVASAYGIGRAIAAEAQSRGSRTLALARDGRLSSAALADAVGSGMIDSGCDVVDIGVAPSPVLYFATEHLGLRSGVMVTASHNPAQYNGFKVILAGQTLSEADYEELYARITRDEFVSGDAKKTQLDVVPAYINTVLDNITLARGLSVVIDGGNGPAGAIAGEVLRRLGCRVDELYCDIDGRFPHHPPDPSDPANIVDLIREVRRTGADIGLAFDGDGDRLGVVDGEGTIVWPDRLLILFIRDLLGRQPGATIVYDVKSTRDVTRAILGGGGNAVMSRTGHSIMRARLLAEDAALAGEFSGHMFFRDRWNGFDDAIYAAARLLELLSRTAETSAAIFRTIPAPLTTHEIRVPVSPGEAAAIMRDLPALLTSDDGTLCRIDGVRVDYRNGWGLVRYSNTLPVLTMRFEADDEVSFAMIKARFKAALCAAAPGLTLSF